MAAAHRGRTTAETPAHRVRVGFIVTRADNGRLCVTCELLDTPHDVEVLALVLRAGRFGVDGRDGVSPEPAAELARPMKKALSHMAP